MPRERPPRLHAAAAAPRLLAGETAGLWPPRRCLCTPPQHPAGGRRRWMACTEGRRAVFSGASAKTGGTATADTHLKPSWSGKSSSRRLIARPGSASRRRFSSYSSSSDELASSIGPERNTCCAEGFQADLLASCAVSELLGKPVASDPNAASRRSCRLAISATCCI